MKAYGDKKLAKYGTVTGKPSCGCCNGSYAKVGKASNKRNALRGLKKSARQESKALTKELLQGKIDFLYDFKWEIGEFANDYFDECNQIIAWNFIAFIQKIAPELCRTNEQVNTYWDIEPKGLYLLEEYWGEWRPTTPERFTELLEKYSKESRY